MNKPVHVKLTHYSPAHLPALRSFELPEEQGQFTSLPVETLAVTEGQYPIVIVSEKEPVGFFLLHSTERVKEYSANPDAMLLTSFSINHAQQGKGYAKQGMLLLPAFIRTEFPACTEIVLAVNHKNIPAQRLYVAAGFADTGRRRMGPLGEQFVFCLPLPNDPQ
ncbi:GNAT family N-acetyltransferase [Brevibacillus agri]|uniref:GNAT family N-acetyltransferase n=1 Tax=Brevibacillus TaxID=55080 RepID=UPI0002717EE0|nr:MULTISPECIES: GNAT family N-acetyltransferase [Brevibacillus]ELK41929.1 GCN5-like N-acetyltransferase [Brevibacillus agri BAB-2500]EJL46326.1 acetyltransferase [Brevibacillus sp. CF112]MDN4096197.1 GNAT family N-acetyltransferase [Brevibacillus agri]MDR9505977.1 GNAT family N-acetyltransferase [Brevibacillus agri]MED1642859.1 GNAT family N-acetyltransferase [Brevibacillus agri]